MGSVKTFGKTVSETVSLENPRSKKTLGQSSDDMVKNQEPKNYGSTLNAEKV